MKPLEEIIELNEGFFCEWREVSDVKLGPKYQTKCGGSPFAFETMPHKTWKYCPLCGKMLKV